MNKFNVKTKAIRLLADTITPVSIYLRIRDVYPNSLLLESSDYHGNENSYSFICLKPLATFEAKDGTATEIYPDKSRIDTPLDSKETFNHRFTAFLESFEQTESQDGIPINGLFGYISYDAVQYFENIKLKAPVVERHKIPDVRYSFYNYIIAINHFQNILHIIENQVNGGASELERIQTY
jgi:anthranilate synthase component 1